MIRFLASIKLAIGLIALLVVLSVVATLYPTVNIYQSYLFRGLIFLFSLNLLTCTLQRLPNAIELSRKKIDIEEMKKEQASYVAIDSLTDNLGVASYLKKNRYRVQQVSESEKTFFLASKGRLSLVAPHLLHLSLIIVLLGAFLGSFGSEDRIMSFVGEKTGVSPIIREGMELRVDDFQTVYDHQGAVDNWVSELTLFVDGKEAASGNTRVNKPFTYQGLVFYQSAYGYTHLIEVIGEQGGFYSIPDGKTLSMGDIYFNIRHYPEGNLIKLYEHDRVLDGQYLEKDDTVSFPDGHTLIYKEMNPYTVLDIKLDPGKNVVMAGFVLMIISSLLFFLGRYQQVKAIYERDTNRLFFRPYSKNKQRRVEIEKELTEHVKGGN